MIHAVINGFELGHAKKLFCRKFVDPSLKQLFMVLNHSFAAAAAAAAILICCKLRIASLTRSVNRLFMGLVNNY